jgi:predicted nucleic acid-binding Zn ribbon protein
MSKDTREMKSNSPTARSRKRPAAISGVLDKVVGSLGLSRNYNGWRVVSQWPQIVGKPIAAKARAIRFSEGRLYVAVQEDAWRQELAMQIGEILRTIHSHPFGRVVKQVRLVMGERGTDADGDRRTGD